LPVPWEKLASDLSFTGYEDGAERGQSRGVVSEFHRIALTPCEHSVTDRNMGEPDNLRARAQQYREMAKEAPDAPNAASLLRLARGLERLAQALDLKEADKKKSWL
jgi:hypothetical protein